MWFVTRGVSKSKQASMDFVSSDYSNGIGRCSERLILLIKTKGCTYFHRACTEVEVLGE